jgi:hypothetical protein
MPFFSSTQFAWQFKFTYMLNKYSPFKPKVFLSSWSRLRFRGFFDEYQNVGEDQNHLSRHKIMWGTADELIVILRADLAHAPSTDEKQTNGTRGQLRVAWRLFNSERD